MRQLFAVKFWQEVSSDTLIINIDVTSINRHIKWNYLWSLKGQAKECTNSPFSGSMSIVMSICSNGAWMSYLTNQTFDGQKFTIFLNHLDIWIQRNKLLGFNDAVIILDNSSVHKVKGVKLKLSKLRMKVIFLAPYSPQLAPIEMYFGILKRRLYQNTQYKSHNINIKENIPIILKALKEIKSEVIIKLFNNLLSLIKNID